MVPMRTHPSHSPDSTSWPRPSLLLWVLWLLFTLAALLMTGSAHAQGAEKTPRYWSDQHGNVVLIGNTLAQGCNEEVPRPMVGIFEETCGRHGRGDDTINRQ